MFTDIKNYRNMNQSNCNCNEICDPEKWSTSNNRRRKTIRKLWQPLKRFVTLKAITVSNKCNSNGINNCNTNNTIPNNVNLNNNVMISSNVQRRRLELERETEILTDESLHLDITAMADPITMGFRMERINGRRREVSVTTVAETNQQYETQSALTQSALIEDHSKLPLDDRLMQYNREEDDTIKGLHVKLPSTKSQPLIQSASIEKETMDVCTNCIYGKNCLHLSNIGKYDMDTYLLSSQLATLPAINNEMEHLREWLKQNSWHMLKNMS